MKFRRCKKCGQIVGMVKETGVPIICCGEPMSELVARVNEEGLNEKHIPVVEVKDGKCVVKVGKVTHPMLEEHFIEWVALVTSKGNQRKTLKPGDTPEVTFQLDKDEEVKEVYAYCNLHQLWMLDLK